MVPPDFSTKWAANPMTKPQIEKVVVNVSVGKSGEPLERAFKVLEQISLQKPTYTKAKTTVKDWGIRLGEPIGCMVTLRGEKATSFLKRALTTLNNRIPMTAFDKNGNFAFGIKEHIELPGTKYDPELGIIGMDVCVALSKPGYRIKNRKLSPGRIGKTHRVTKEEAFQVIKEACGAEIIGEKAE